MANRSLIEMAAHLPPRAKRVLRWGACQAEGLFGGSRLPERILLGLLQQYYSSRFRFQWIWSKQPPHLYDHRFGLFDFGYAVSDAGP